ncbi:uncharacterized protein BXZ73DRAFT_95760 [Epithele typhae]|uniref:uncharacterized protein n=1 Tax=Epithele typhae TaxID=378194 RepID=UPI0020073F7D|nr:uncharacterized protein BXZ73DRAFT_95760 [Epithele typhae]KAH9946258.1 hypothetical protein BXZ73DRAFT_95760 [Epithele typhae]
MADSGDVDISMFHGIVPSDSWLSVEASMGEDILVADAPTFVYTSGDVEVDMDDDEPITEYEMADEGDLYDNAEIQDIEVYDASQAPSPLSMEHHPVISDTASFSMRMPSSDGLEIFEQQSPSISAQTTSQPSGAELGTSFVHPEELPLPSVDFPSYTVEPQPPVTTENTAFGGDVLAEPESGVGDAVPTVLEYTSPQYEPLDALPAHQGSIMESTSGYTEVGVAAEAVAAEITELRHSTPDFPQHDDSDGAAAEASQDATEVSAPFEANDPHEISEGVWIDPPPAVLLSLPPSAPHPEYTLFNLPTSDVSNSPSGSNQPDPGFALPLLLQEHPTLYYEPLSVVFAALRQQQIIQELQQFHEAELVLDAYDLQLCISEDNVYTHEVTLHELNVLHDGSDLRGPLRLRLRLSVPRFATRYNTLREQIARLNVAEEAEQAHADDGERLPSVQDADETVRDRGEAVFDGVADQDALDALAVSTDHEHFESEAGTHAELTKPSAEHEDVTRTDAAGEREDAAAEDDIRTVGEGAVNGTYAEEDVGDAVGVTEAKVEEGAIAASVEESERTDVEEGSAEDADGHDALYEGDEDTLDADQVHEPAVEEAGNEEAGEYIEHESYPDDEEEGFGEDFSSENGRPHEMPDNTAGEEGIYADDLAFGDSHEAADAVSEGRSMVPTINKLQLQLPVSTEPDDYDEFEEDDEASTEQRSLEDSDTLSRKSSSATLSSKTSKRAYEEVELHDFGEGDADAQHELPDPKRARIE